MRSNTSPILTNPLIGFLVFILTSGFTGNIFAQPPELASIEITPTDPSLNVGQSEVFTAERKDQYGDPYTFDLIWEGDGTHGNITPHSTNPPTCTYTATQSGNGYNICWESPGIPGTNIFGSTDITITPGGGQALTTIKVEPKDITISLGESQLYTATGYDQDGEPMDPPISPI